MIASKYNHYIEENGFAYFFNGLTKTYFRTPLETGRKINIYLNSDVSVLFHRSSIGEKLLKNGFLVNDDIIELDAILCNRNAEITNKDYFLIILPTLNCNFKCWYCIQDHIQSMMSEEIKDRILRHIDYMIDVNRINSLHIEWFGGEPFMYFEEIIKPIGSYAQAKCLENNISFKHSATTNGYYLTSNIHYDLKKLALRKFHITLDGNKEMHNSVKHCDCCNSAFDRTLNNINQILSYDKNSSLILRINYTDDNLDESIINDVNNFIHSENRSRVLVNLKKVWQIKNNNTTSHKAQNIREEFMKYGYRATLLDIVCNFTSCYVEKMYYNAINYNGNIVKCTAIDDLNTRKPYGILDNNGEIIWNNSQTKNFFKRELPKPCQSCKYLPLCMGPCPHDSNAQGSFKCKLSGQFSNIRQMIVSFINSRYDYEVE